MDERVFQIQRILADELDQYKRRENKYVDMNIKEIQELYMAEEAKKEDKGTTENDEVILVRPYKVSMTTSSSTTSFITDEVENLLKHMKGENNPTFWKEVVTAFLKKKHNTETARNGYQIHMFQGGPPHEPYFIVINNKDQVIIGPSKKIVATHMVGELEVLV